MDGGKAWETSVKILSVMGEHRIRRLSITNQKRHSCGHLTRLITLTVSELTIGYGLDNPGSEFEYR
jgi:hypothetical protein